MMQMPYFLLAIVIVFFFEAPGIESLAASIWLLNIFMYFEEFLGASLLRFKPLCSLLASYYCR